MSNEENASLHLLTSGQVLGTVLNALWKNLIYSLQKPFRSALSLFQIYRKEKRGSKRVRNLSRATHLGGGKARIGP